MPLTHDDLMDPIGPLDATLFPDQPLNAIQVRLDVMIEDAYEDSRIVALDPAIQDGAVRAWVLYNVFDRVYQRMIAEPLTVTRTEKGSTGYSADQIKLMNARALAYLAEFNQLVGAQQASSSQKPIGVKNTFVW